MGAGKCGIAPREALGVDEPSRARAQVCTTRGRNCVFHGVAWMDASRLATQSCDMFTVAVCPGANVGATFGDPPPALDLSPPQLVCATVCTVTRVYPVSVMCAQIGVVALCPSPLPPARADRAGGACSPRVWAVFGFAGVGRFSLCARPVCGLVVGLRLYHNLLQLSGEQRDTLGLATETRDRTLNRALCPLSPPPGRRWGGPGGDGVLGVSGGCHVSGPAPHGEVLTPV